jgi:hypothetical protein
VPTERPPVCKRAAIKENLSAIPLVRLDPGEYIYRVGGGVSAPSAIYRQQPEYTREASSAKLPGIVVLSIVGDKLRRIIRQLEIQLNLG